jgi:hypothetical protein
MALTGNPPKNNYLDLLYLDNANSGLPASVPQVLKDGGDNASLLALSETEIEFIGILSATVVSGLVIDTGIDFTADAVVTDKITYKTDTDVGIHFVSGTPEAAVVASPGSLAIRNDGGAGTSLYIKETGTGNAGWTPVKIITDFLDLDNMPVAYAAEQFVRVNSSGTALEFTSTGVIEIPATSAQGEVLYYDGSGWVNLGVGTDGYVLTTHGAASDPTWEEVTGGSGIPEPTTPAQGEILYYTGSAWDALGVGSAGQALISGGAAADPTWGSVDGMPSGTQGDIAYHNGSAWVVLTPGTAGYVLQTGGVAANPSWVAASAGTTFISLTDTPANYGSAYQILNSNGSAVTWNTLSNVIWNAITPTPTEDQVLGWNGSGLEWMTPASAGIPAPGTPAQGEILYYTGSSWDALSVGTSGQVLTTGGLAANPTWTTPSTGVTTFVALSDTPNNWTGSANKTVKVNSSGNALEFVSVSSGGGKDYVLSEYDTGDTYGGKPIYAIIVDFGAGPNNTTKSVASGLGINDVFHVIDMQVAANDDDEGWVGQEDNANKASFTYNKLDYKVYATTTVDLSGVTYSVLLKYIKEPVTMAGANPHVIVTVSGGTWGGLGPGVHLLTPSSYTFTTAGGYSTPTAVVFNWSWSGTGVDNVVAHLNAILTAGNRSSSFIVSFYDGTTNVTTTLSQHATTTTAPSSPYNKGIGPGDRLFHGYTVDGKTITIARASDFPLRPAKTS